MNYLKKIYNKIQSLKKHKQSNELNNSKLILDQGVLYCVGCEMPEYVCTETLRCAMCCEFPGHNHCIINDCLDFFNTCGEFSQCIVHCENTFNHRHCDSFLYSKKYYARIPCENILNFCKDSSQCIKHCLTSGHSHCSVNECDEISDICEKSSLCLKHLNETTRDTTNIFSRVYKKVRKFINSKSQ